MKKSCDSCGNFYTKEKYNPACMACHEQSQWIPLPGGTSTEQGHYMSFGDLQPIEIMQRTMPPEQFKGFLRGNALKYLLRAGTKDDPAKEYDKAAQYATWLAQAERG